MNPSPDKLREAIAFLTAHIRDAERQLKENGRLISLGDLESQVNQICAQVKTMPGAQARICQPLMAELISALDYLAESLSAYTDSKR